MVYEVVAFAVDGVMGSGGGRVDVALMPDGGVRVTAVAPGGRAGVLSAVDVSRFEERLTVLPIWSPPGYRRSRVVAYPVGAGVVNALSARMTAEVRCAGGRWVGEYTCGVLATSLTDGGTGVGTDAGNVAAVMFRPDSGIFETTEFSFDELAGRFREVALLDRQLEISLTDLREVDCPRSVQFRHSDGVRDFVALLDGRADSTGDPLIVGFERDDPRMAGTVDIAFCWRGSGEERIHTFANSCATLGGTHERGFRDGLAEAIVAYTRRQPSGQQLVVDPARIGEGLTAVVSVKLDHPEYDGCTRDILGNAVVYTCVADAVREHLGRWFDDHPDQAAAIVRGMT
ncbi:DNA gyrase subunit B [Uniformispora flossi]|uniref:DNA gyrase subunit B n=1 Tax=Uniformispora flossi TaxID=3390723 RepID=UPI003C2B4379